VRIIEKILAGGVTFTIQPATKKSEELPVAVTFPRMRISDRRSIVINIRNHDTNIDSVLAGINKQLTDVSKLIQVNGIDGLTTDSLISIYNEQDIKAMGLLDAKKAYTLALSIPLKYLKRDIDNSATFRYNVKLNGAFNGLKPPKGSVPITPGSIRMVRVELSASQAADAQNLNNPTDFSGKYTLADIR